MLFFFFFFQAEDGIRDVAVTGVQTCALPISDRRAAGGVRAPAGRVGLPLRRGPVRARAGAAYVVLRSARRRGGAGRRSRPVGRARGRAPRSRGGFFGGGGGGPPGRPGARGRP